MKILTKLIMVGFIFFMLSGNSFAITVDGNYTDWFSDVTGFQVTDNIANDTTGEIDTGFTNGIFWAEEDVVASGDSGQVYPGYGGQSFDHEGLYATQDDDDYYIGFMTGMAPGANYTSWSTTAQYIGDIAINTGNGFDQAISMHSIRNEIPFSNSTSYYSMLYSDVTNWVDTNYYHPVYSNETPYRATNFTGGSLYIDFAYTQHGESYFYEFGIDKSLLDTSEGVKFFVTMSCGNDWLEVHNDPTAVPEPSTALLLGCGLLSMAGIGNRKLFKK